MNKIPWVDESSMTPSQKEHSRWIRWEQAKAKERMKHDKNLPEDCHGCSVGARWSKIESINLVQALILCTKGKKQTIVILADLCREFNRTSGGILYRLKSLGFLAKKEGSFDLKPLNCMSRKNSEKLAFDFPEIAEMLMLNGWRKDHLNRFIAPVWFTMISFSYQGMNNGKELDW